MNAYNCKPTVQTLNRVLEMLARNPAASTNTNLPLQMIAEVRRFGVEPSLGSYQFLLNIYCKTGMSSLFVIYFSLFSSSHFEIIS